MKSLVVLMTVIVAVCTVNAADELTEERVKTLSLDYDKEQEIIHFASPQSPQSGSVMVVDFKKSVTAMYMAENDRCYVIGGVDHNIASPFKNEGAIGGTELDYTEASDYPLEDTTVLPAYLDHYCEGRQVRWLEKRQQAEPSVRSLSVGESCVKVCVEWKDNRWCLRWRCK